MCAKDLTASGVKYQTDSDLPVVTNQDNTLMDSPGTEPPSLKGFLHKYVNVAKGYNTRWFVLQDGLLSYYRHQEDEDQTCRGSFSMKNTSIKVSSDRLRYIAVLIFAMIEF